MNPLYEQMQVSVFERMSLAAVRHGAVNLGQGFPDFGWPEEVVREAAHALGANNQYPPSRGLPLLRQAIASHYRRHFGEALESDHVCVTSGATEAIAACLLAAIEPGDEVVIFTPAYDAYAPMIRRAGGIVKAVALQPPDWRITRVSVEAAVTPKTRLILFNNPHNPTGRLFDRQELEAVASVAVAHDLLLLSDEVWEHVLLGEECFCPIATLDGMAERTLKAGSAGKIFSLTGWKVGWIVADPRLASIVARAHQFLTFSTPPNLQAAVAYGLEEGTQWLLPMRRDFKRAKDRLTSGLEAAGFRCLAPQSTYFLCVDLAASGIALDDEAFAAMAVERAGVAVIPLSPFLEGEGPRHLVRLCFAKQDETIDRGIEAMAKSRAIARAD